MIDCKLFTLSVIVVLRLLFTVVIVLFNVITLSLILLVKSVFTSLIVFVNDVFMVYKAELNASSCASVYVRSALLVSRLLTDKLIVAICSCNGDVTSDK